MLNMRKWILLAPLCVLFSGCNVTWPSIFSPGTVSEQQQRAAVFDPYTQPDQAPPVVGARPRDYQDPRAEPVQSQTYPNMSRRNASAWGG